MKTIVNLFLDGKQKEILCDAVRVNRESECLELCFNNKVLFVELVELSTTHKLSLEVKPIKIDDTTYITGMVLIAPYDALGSIMY